MTHPRRLLMLKLRRRELDVITRGLSETCLNKDVIQVIHSFLINRRFMLIGKIDDLQADARDELVTMEDSETVQRIFRGIYERVPQEEWPSSYVHLSKLSADHFMQGLFDIDYDPDLDSDLDSYTGLPSHVVPFKNELDALVKEGTNWIEELFPSLVFS